MKTLDEIITELKTIYDRYESEGCFYCSFQRECASGYCYLADALHYLKEYQRYQNTPSRNGHMALVDYFEESQKNPPLTWDELKQMEGEPVWVEMDKPDVIKAWFLICQIDDSFVWVADSKGKSHNFPRVCLDTGLWQAYRKEKS